MTITNYTDRELRLQAEVAELKAENENLRAYAKHERSLGAEPFAMENLDLMQQVEILKAKLAEYEAARIAYASEFPLNDKGEPAVGDIHQNIRLMKAKLAETERDYERFRVDYNEKSLSMTTVPNPRVIEIYDTCNQHPDAPHGYLRDASHNEGRYICECEFWTPGEES